MRVDRRIYGPGPRPGSRVLLAAPGVEYPEHFLDGVVVLDDPAEPADSVVVDPAEVDEEVDQDDDDEEVGAEGGSALDEMSKEELLELAAEQGVTVDRRARKADIIAALSGDTGLPGE